MKTTDFKKGDAVVYVPKHEDGVVTSINEKYVFVKYTILGGSQATRPEDLVHVALRS